MKTEEEILNQYDHWVGLYLNNKAKNHFNEGWLLTLQHKVEAWGWVLGFSDSQIMADLRGDHLQ